MPDTNQSEALLPVEQIDREAASAIADLLMHNGVEAKFNADFPFLVIKSVWDNHPLVQAFARHRFSSHPQPSSPVSPAIPAGMVPWHGGDSAPEDWNGREVLLRDGAIGIIPRHLRKGARWRHLSGDVLPSGDIIAYTPKSAPASHIAPDALREFEVWLDGQRDAAVSECFREIVSRYSTALRNGGADV